MDADVVDRAIADTGFSGVVRLDLPDGSVIERAAGLADRRWRAPMTPSTRLSIASATKGFTALAVMALVEREALTLGTRARTLLGRDLPSVDDDVTIEHLLAHRSGIGDYLDESAMASATDHVMPVPVHVLDSTEAYLRVLDGHPQLAPPGELFAYNNGGFVLLALLAERAATVPFATLVDDLVCTPAGLTDTGFLRSDSLPPGVATGYLDDEGLRTNALHLPVLGSGDGGLFSTTADLARFWMALLDERIVSGASVTAMLDPRSVGEGGTRYGLGFWLAPDGPGVMLEGYDAGISCRTAHDPTTGATTTVISNTTDGAWPMLRTLQAQ